MGTKGADAAGMTPLAQLVVDTMRRRGWSMQQVEARGISHSSLHRFTQPVAYSQTPRKASLEKLALVLDLPLSQVQKAAMQSVGYVYSEAATPDTTAIIASLNELTEQQQKDAAAQLAAWAAEVLDE